MFGAIVQNVNQACGDHVLAVSQELTSPQIHPLRGVLTNFFFGVWNSYGGAVHTIMQNLQISCEIFAKFPLVICETAKKKFL